MFFIPHMSALCPFPCGEVPVNIFPHRISRPCRYATITPHCLDIISLTHPTARQRIQEKNGAVSSRFEWKRAPRIAETWLAQGVAACRQSSHHDIDPAARIMDAPRCAVPSLHTASGAPGPAAASLSAYVKIASTGQSEASCNHY